MWLYDVGQLCMSAVTLLSISSCEVKLFVTTILTPWCWLESPVQVLVSCSIAVCFRHCLFLGCRRTQCYPRHLKLPNCTWYCKLPTTWSCPWAASGGGDDIGPSYTFRLSDLPKLDLQVDRGTNFTAWCLQWQSYCNLFGLAGQETSKKVATLSLCVFARDVSIVKKPGPYNQAEEQCNVNHWGASMLCRWSLKQNRREL